MDQSIQRAHDTSGCDPLSVGSIKEIDLKDGSSSDGPWEPKILEIEGEKISLNDIEHRILRPIWQDPRIHYAVNCASVGCPNLRRDAYVGRPSIGSWSRRPAILLTTDRAVSFDNGDLIVSSIYVGSDRILGAPTTASLRIYAAMPGQP